MTAETPRELPLLEAKNLSISAENGFETRPLTFSIAKGSFVLVEGPIGSGKSLLCEALLGVERPGVAIRGRIEVPSDGDGRRRRRFEIGFVPEDPRLAALPTDTVEVLLEEATRRRNSGSNKPTDLADAILERLGVDASRIRPVPFRSLSSGERKLVLLAQALLTRAPLVVLDGLFEGLSARASALVIDLLDESARGGRAFLATVRSRSLGAGLPATDILSLSEGVETPPLPLLPHSPKTPSRVAPAALLAVERLRASTVRSGFFTRRLGHPILRGLSLEVRAGEALALLGDHGSGKSALLEAIVGYRRIASGSIRYRGRELRPDDGRSRKGLQLVLAENSDILEPRRKVRDFLGGSENAKRLLERFELPSRLLDENHDSLSAGEAELVSLLVRLDRKPTLLLVDDPPFSEGSVFSSNLLSTFLFEKNEGTSILVTTSSLAAARSYGDRIAHVFRGKTLEIAAAESFVESPAHPMTKKLVEGKGLEYPKTEPKGGCFYFEVCERRRQGDCDVREPALAFVPGADSGVPHLVACFYPLPRPRAHLVSDEPTPTPPMHATLLPGDAPSINEAADDGESDSRSTLDERGSEET